MLKHIFVNTIYSGENVNRDSRSFKMYFARISLKILIKFAEDFWFNDYTDSCLEISDLGLILAKHAYSVYQPHKTNCFFFLTEIRYIYVELRVLLQREIIEPDEEGKAEHISNIK